MSTEPRESTPIFRVDNYTHGPGVEALIKGKRIGRLVLEPAPHQTNAWSARSLQVVDEFQRRGVATAMFDAAWRAGNRPIVPSRDVNSQGYAFWYANQKRNRTVNGMPHPDDWLNAPDALPWQWHPGT
jgi:hypothetical protein